MQKIIEKKNNIVLGITGSIAAYKAIDLAKELKDHGYNLSIVLSQNAPNFISLLTLKSFFPNSVFTANDALDSKNEQMLHISLAKKAHLILIAPCSANFIAKVANGFADCLLSSICLATTSPIFIAPAMNKEMWNNQALQHNIKKLQNNGVNLIGPSEGKQACGDYGFGRIEDTHKIIEHILKLNSNLVLQGKKITITAGPTYEKIDPVRYIGNFSSGKMGYALAEIAANMGAEVTLVTGPSSLLPPRNINLIKVESAEEMYHAVYKLDHNIFISAAAVSDYKPLIFSEQKIKKNDSEITLNLTKNIDILAEIKKNKSHIYCVGFAAETENMIPNAQKKLDNKNLDMIVANNVSDNEVFGQDYNQVTIITRNNPTEFIAKSSKLNIARIILEAIAKDYTSSNQ